MFLKWNVFPSRYTNRYQECSWKRDNKQMKKTKKMRAKCLYLFKSTACSNTVYYEELNHAKNFLQLAQQHLKEYLYIHEYMLCQDGWVFLARLKSEKQIQKAYANKRKKYKKLPKEMPVWKIVSEQIRLFIASYVTQYNQSTGREGGLVKRVYERYYFETKQEAKRVIQGIRRRVIGIQQAKKMYRPKKGHYRIPKKLGKGGIFLSSRRKKRWGGKVKNILDLSVFQYVRFKLLTKTIKKSILRTKTLHNTPIPDF